MKEVIIKFSLPGDYDSLNTCLNSGKMREFILAVRKKRGEILENNRQCTSYHQGYRDGRLAMSSWIEDLASEIGIDLDDI